MARPASHAAARAQPLRPAFRRPLLRAPGRRTVLAALAGLAVLSLAYAVARESSLFALDEFEIVGPPAEVRDEVREALDDLRGTSLVKLDAADVERDLRALPSVLAAEVDRSFPHSLRIVVVPEEPLAVVRDGQAAWVVSRRGRVIRPAEAGWRSKLPWVWNGSAGELAPGDHVAEAEAVAKLEVLLGVPEDFPVRVRAARGPDDALTLTLVPELELRLGMTDDLDLKLAAAAAVLRAMSRSERLSLAYLDVSLPQRPVGMNKSQVSTDS